MSVVGWARSRGCALELERLYNHAAAIAARPTRPAGRSDPVHYESAVSPIFQRYLYRPIVVAVEWLADAVRPIQSGDVNLYLLYVFVTVLLAYLLGGLG